MTDNHQTQAPAAAAAASEKPPEQTSAPASPGSGTGAASPKGTAASEAPDIDEAGGKENQFGDMNPFDYEPEGEDEQIEEALAGEDKPAKPKETTVQPVKAAEAKPGETGKPAAAAEAPTTEAKPGEVKPEVKPGETPPAAPVKQKTFYEVLGDVQEKAIPELAKMYSIPPEMAKHFTPEQLPVFSQLAAMQHMNLLRATAAMMENIVPTIVARYQTQNSAQKEAEEQFFKAWPQLTKEHVPLLTKYGKIWAQANPDGKLEDYIKEVGTMVAHATGLLGAAPAKAQEAASAPAGGQPKTRVIPFAPAPAGGAGSSTKKPVGTGPMDWGNLADALTNFED